MSEDIRVRFAPSPTGPLHIGGVRTALYNYLFARKQGGRFILRIEDTDQTRYVSGAEDYIIESMKWLGLSFDEGPEQGGPYAPYKQSERKEIYRQYADLLLNNQKAYIAFDSPEELDAKRSEAESTKQSFKYDASTRMQMNNSLSLSETEVAKKISEDETYVIRIKIPENMEIVVNDMIRGEVRFSSSELDDKVLFKSDGLPTYHLANVVDDYLMRISHVIRGEEWLPSAPLHVLLYEYLGWKEQMPSFAHMPLILKPTGKGKLSKRDGDAGGFPVFPLAWKDPESGEIFNGYRESGYFPEAVCNILAFLGWNPGTEQEIFSMDELINAFSLDRVGKSGARFDPEKAKWYNHHYMQSQSVDFLADQFSKTLTEKGIKTDTDLVKKVITQVRERATFIDDLWDQSWFFFQSPESYDEKVVQKRWKEDSPALLTGIADLLSSVNDFSSQQIETEIKTYLEQNGLGFGQVMNILRLCLIGSGMGPHLFDIASLIGKEETIRRIRNGIEKLK